MLYRRTFGTDKRFQGAVLIVGIMCIAWWLGASLGAALRCSPVQSQLNVSIPGKCYNVQRFFIAVEIPNCLLDFVIVAMPVGVIQGLHLQLKHKITLSFIFLLGSLYVVFQPLYTLLAWIIIANNVSVGFISIIRMAIVYKFSGSGNTEQTPKSGLC